MFNIIQATVHPDKRVTRKKVDSAAKLATACRRADRLNEKTVNNVDGALVSYIVEPG